MPGVVRSVALACFGVTFILYLLAHSSTHRQTSSRFGGYRLSEPGSASQHVSQISYPPTVEPITANQPVPYISSLPTVEPATSSQPVSYTSSPPIVEPSSSSTPFDVVPTYVAEALSPSSTTSESSNTSIGIVSMLYGEPEEYYVRAIHSFQRYALRHNYKDFVLKREITVGDLSGVWNKCAYLLHILIQELAKPEEERLQWLFWVDADAVVANPSIPLDIFLPPSDFDSFDIIASRDESGFNMGIFFLRVSSWSAAFMNKLLAYTQYHPKADLFWKEQSAAMELFKESDTKRHVLYQPRMWWNPYQRMDTFEGEHGSMIIHFPNLGGSRGPRMDVFLDEIEAAETGVPSELEVPLEDSRYPQHVEQFWNTLRYARETKDFVMTKVPNLGGSSREFQEAVLKLKDMWFENTDLVHKLANVCKEIYIAYEEHESEQAKAAKIKLKGGEEEKDSDLDLRFRYDNKWIDEEEAERSGAPLEFGHDGNDKYTSLR